MTQRTSNQEYFKGFGEAVHEVERIIEHAIKRAKGARTSVDVVQAFNDVIEGVWELRRQHKLIGADPADEYEELIEQLEAVLNEKFQGSSVTITIQR
jgi:hypothetical protein